MEPESDWYYGDENHPIDLDEIVKVQDVDLGEEYENEMFWQSVCSDPDDEIG